MERAIEIVRLAFWEARKQRRRYTPESDDDTYAIELSAKAEALEEILEALLAEQG